MTERTRKKYAKDLKPGYTIAGEKVVEKVTPSPVVEEKSEVSDRFTEETKPQLRRQPERIRYRKNLLREV